MKKISVIVNCHNGEKYLADCLGSILKQKYKNLEIILYDNFSTDKSKIIANNFKDDRIKLFSSNKKLHLYDARNEAINNASGELIAFLDVDDWWDENYLISRAKKFDDYNYDIFYTNTLIFYEKNKRFSKYKDYILPTGKIYKKLAKDYCIIISGLILRKKIFDKIGGFNPKFNIIGDFDFVMRASKTYNFHALDEPLIFYRMHQNNFSKKNSSIFFEEFRLWFKNQLDCKDQDFLDNKKYFQKRLLFLEINHLLLNKDKNFDLLKKIVLYPNILQKLKFMIGFMLPKVLIKYLKK